MVTDVAAPNGAVAPMAGKREDDVPAAPTSPPAAEACASEAGISVGDTAERARLLDRLFEAARKIGELPFLRLAVERVEALQLDCAERSALESEAHEIAEQQRKTRQPALIRQLAFYFSDANLRNDAFLRGVIESDPHGPGFVPITMLLGFNRLKTMGVAETAEVASAVEAAPAAAGIELSPARDAVRRAGGHPLPPAPSAEVATVRDECTVRIERLPRGDTTVTSEAIVELCTPFGSVAHVWLIRAKGGLHAPVDEPNEFLGIAEVEFASVDAANAAIAADPPPAWCGNALRLRSLADFRAERSEARGSKRPQPAGGEDEATSKRARIEEEAVASAARFDRGVVLRLDDVPVGITWIEIKEAFSVYGEVVYVDTPKAGGDSRQIYVRMRESQGAAAAVEALSRTGGCLSLELPAQEEAWSSLASGDVEATAQPAEEAPQTKEPTVDADANGETPASTDAPSLAVEETPDEPVPQSDPYGGGEEVSQTDPYGGGDEVAAPTSETTEAKPNAAPAADSAVPSTVAPEAEDTADGDADDSLFVVDTQGCAVQTDAEGKTVATSDSGVAANDESAAGRATSSSSPKTVSVKVVLLAGEEEEKYIQKMALAMAEKRAAKGGSKDGGKGSKGAKKGKDGGKGKSAKGVKGKKESKEGKRSGKKGAKRAKRDYSDCYSDDSSPT